MGERCNSCLYGCFQTNFSRDLWFLLLQSIGVVLTLAVLASASSGPTASMSWGKFVVPDITIGDSTTDLNYNIGLIRAQLCYDDSACVYADVGIIPAIGSKVANGGKAVISALTFAMVFALAAIVIHFLYVFGRAEKLRLPRVILNICNFMVLLLQIVSISSWYQFAQDNLASILYVGNNGRVYNVSSVAPGNAVAVNILVICMTFFAWGFSFWRTCRPKDGGAALGGSTFAKSNSAEGMTSPKSQSQRSDSILESGKKKFATAAVQSILSPSNVSSDNYSSDGYSSPSSAYGNNGGGYRSKSPSSAYGGY